MVDFLMLLSISLGCCLLFAATRMMDQTPVANLIFQSWRWYWLGYLLVFWEAKKMITIFYGMCPSNIRIISTPLLIGRSFTSWKYLLFAENLHAKGHAEVSLFEFLSLPILETDFKQGKGKPYAIPSRNQFRVCVSSREHIDDINNASPSQLSVKGIMLDQLHLDHSLGGVVGTDHNVLIARNVFGYRLRSCLPTLRQPLQKAIENVFQQEITDNLDTRDGWARVSLHNLTTQISLTANNHTIVGGKLANDPKYSKTVHRFLLDITIAAEILHHTPKFLSGLVSAVCMKWSGARTKLYRYLTAEILTRRDLSSHGDGGTRDSDCLQWIMDHSEKDSTEVVAQQTMSFMIGSAHQMPIFLGFVIRNLCLYPEYIQPLLDEIREFADRDFDNQNREMPYLDSFLKETARLNSITCIGIPRKVVSPFTFSDGTHVPANNWVCVSQQALMTDPTMYPDPNTFNGFRFVTKNGEQSARSDSRLTHSTWAFTFWGSVKQSCPGRFYVSMVAKMIIAHLIENYDFKMVDQNISPTFAYDVIKMPNPLLQLALRRRTRDS